MGFRQETKAYEMLADRSIANDSHILTRLMLVRPIKPHHRNSAFARVSVTQHANARTQLSRIQTEVCSDESNGRAEVLYASEQ